MEKIRIFSIHFLIFFVVFVLVTPAVWAAEKYKVGFEELIKQKKMFDDPRPFRKVLSYKNVMPPDAYAKFTHDVEKMKQVHAEVVGFKAPDLVGKIAPEIKPGTYTYRDKEKYPGFKELIPPELYESFNPGAPPLGCNFPEIKIIPAKQYYWALPVIEATKKYIGRTQLDNEGIIKEETHVLGYPFPRPSGNFKANQIIYNWLRRYSRGENSFIVQVGVGIASSLRIDREVAIEVMENKMDRRVIAEPYGWFDERAKKQGENISTVISYFSPRDSVGNVISSTNFLDSEKFDLNMVYVNSLRRVRVLSGSDVQDSQGGADIIYMDNGLFNQKPSKTFFPYKAEVIADREYLMPAYLSDGSGYLSSKGMELRNYEWERRPMYVVKLTSLDKNFVYSYRHIYFDKETFDLRFIANYDRKGRLYRTANAMNWFVPEMGIASVADAITRDHLDQHTSFAHTYTLPVDWMKRGDFSLRGVYGRGK